MLRTRLASLLLGIAVVSLISSCGGGGGGGPGSGGVIPATAIITGRVTGAGTNPIEGAVLTLEAPVEPGVAVATDTTGPDGTFSLQASPGTWILRITRGGSELLQQTIVAPDAELDLGDLHVLAIVHGSIVGGVGQPIANALVTIGTVPPTILTTGSNGSFEAELPTGTYDLGVRLSGFIVHQSTFGITLPGPVNLAPIQVLTRIQGLLLDGVLAPLTGIFATVNSTPPAYATTGADGQFALEVAQGAYQLKLFRNGSQIHQQTVMVQSIVPVDVGPLQLLASVSGAVVDTGANPVLGAIVTLDTVPPETVSTPAAGTFQFAVPIQTHHVTVRRNGVNVAQILVQPVPWTGPLYLGSITVNEGLDSDGDGLANGLEFLGWDIVIREGNGTQTVRHVTSDPMVVDTEGDGVPDGLEFTVQSDPHMSDTDGDGLSDVLEVTLYKSHPADVDTDGDAQPLDASGAPVGLPNPALYDGPEVLASKTSPLLADTDGDGMNDYLEITGGGFRPLVADQPLIDIEVVSDPLVELNSTVTQGTVSQVMERDQTAQSRTDASTTQSTTENTQSISATAKVAYPPAASLEVTAGASWKQGSMNETSTNFNQSSQQELQTQLDQTQNETFSSATIKTAMRVRNQSNLSFLLQDLRILAYRVSPQQGAGSLQILGTLFEEVTTGQAALLGAGAPGVVLSPGGDVTIAMSNDELNYQPILEYVRKPGALFFEVGLYSLKKINEQGQPIADYDAIAQKVVERTAVVVIDFGGGHIERYAVAANLRRNPDGSAMGTTMSEIFDVLDIAHQTSLGSTPASAGMPGTAGRQVLTGVRNSLADPSSSPQDPATAWWGVIGPHVNEPDPANAGLELVKNFDEIVLKPGERITLIYFQDLDQDGLEAHQEALYGTSDVAADTDGDGLTDLDEVSVGWDVHFAMAPQFDYHVFPNPRYLDVDQDSVPDALEQTMGTDPNLADTDRDGVIDSVDPDPLTTPSSGGTVALPTSGLLVHYRFNETSVLNPSSSPMASNEAGTGNDGVIESQYVAVPHVSGNPDGVSLFPDRFLTANRAFFFEEDSSNQVCAYVKIPVSATAPQWFAGWSWAAWVYPENYQGNGAGPVVEQANWARLQIQDAGGTHGTLKVDLLDSQNTVTNLLAEPSPSVPEAAWSFVCLTVGYDSITNQSTVKLYVNTTNVASTTMTGVLVDPTGIQATTIGAGRFFGSSTCNQSDSFFGAIDDVRLYNRPLSAAEVSALFNELHTSQNP